MSWNYGPLGKMTKASLLGVADWQERELKRRQLRIDELQHDYDMLKCLADEMELREEERLRRLDYMVERQFLPWYKRLFK